METSYLAHHGVKGQKWGIRKQRPLLGRSRGGSSSKSTGLLNSNYHSEYGKQMYAGNKKAYKASNELDKKINDYRKSMSLGKQFVRETLMTDSMNLTYDMARASGYGRVRSYLKSCFDLSVPNFAGGMVASTANSFRDASNPTSGKNKALATAAFVGNRVTDRAITDRGTELSLQQRALRKRYVANHS